MTSPSLASAAITTSIYKPTISHTPLPSAENKIPLDDIETRSVDELLIKRSLTPTEDRNNQNALVVQAQNNTVGLNIHNPDLTKPSIEANPKLLEQQLAKLGSVLSDVKPQERNQVFSDVADNFVTEAKRAGFDISAINNSSAGKFAHMLTLLIQVALESRESTADMANMGREIAHNTNRASTQKNIDAAEVRMTQAITTGVTSTVISGAGGFRAGKGLQTQSSAMTNHGMKSVEAKFQRGALETERQAFKPSIEKAPTQHADKEHLGKSPNDLKREQGQQEIHQQHLQLIGQQQQGQGQVAMSSANGIGSIAGAPLYVNIAEDEAAASKLNTDKDILLSASEASKRMADQEGKIKDELVQLMHRVAEARNNTISAMTGNLKG